MPRNRSAIDFRSFDNFDFSSFRLIFSLIRSPTRTRRTHRSSPVRRSGAKGRAQRRQDASQVPGITAERCGIDPQSIFEVLKILKFFKIFKIFPRFGLPPGPGPWAHTGWLERRRGASPRGRGPQRRVLDSPHLLHLSQRSYLPRGSIAGRPGGRAGRPGRVAKKGLFLAVDQNI